MQKSSREILLRADREEWIEALGANPDCKTLSAIGIPPALWASISGGRRPSVSLAATRLMQYRRSAQLADLLGPAWFGFEVRGGLLQIQGWRRPFDPAELRASLASIQRIQLLEHEARRLRKERAEAWQRVEAAESAAGFYRGQLVLESRCGLMLARVAFRA